MFLHLSAGHNWGPNVVLFCFLFFSRIIIVIFHKTWAHFKIWDYDLWIKVTLFSQITLSQDLIYSLGYLALTISNVYRVHCPLSWKHLLLYCPLCSPTSIFQDSLLDFDNNNGVSINNNIYLYYPLLTEFYAFYWSILLAFWSGDLFFPITLKNTEAENLVTCP